MSKVTFQGDLSNLMYVGGGVTMVHGPSHGYFEGEKARINLVWLAVFLQF